MKIVRHLFKRLAARDPRPSAAPAPLLMALEPRIVYDASVAAVGAAQHHAGLDAHAASSRPIAERAHEIAVAADSDGPGPRSNLAVRHVAEAPRDAGGTAAGQVVFFDASVAHYQQLVAGLPAGTRYVVLDSATDGLAQIAQYLQQHPGVESIHLVSHGADGQIQVGATWLNQTDIAEHSAALAQIGAAMKPGGDFLIYGCDVAQRADGQALVRQIASISHLNVAASTDATGAASLGGDWTLEYTAGAVHTPVVFSSAAEQRYNGLLSVYVETYDTAVGFDTGGSPVVSTALDGLVYTSDQPIEWQVVAGSLPNSASGGEFIVNVQGTQMSSLTIQRQDGSLMAVQSFDIDIFVSNQNTVQALDASGAVIGSVVLNIANNGNNSMFHVDLSNNPAFAQVKSLRITETSGNGTFLSPTLDNFAYLAPSSPPTLTATGGNTAFVAGDNTASTPVAVDSGITLTDGNSSTARSATVSIAGNFHTSEDLLGFSNTSAATYGNIVGSYSTATGVLTLTSSGGTASIAQWQAAFRAVTYTDTALTPNTSTRLINFQVQSDGYTGGNVVSKLVTVAATDQTPIVSTAHVTRNYVAGSSAVTIDGTVAVSDLDNATQSSGTVSIGAGFHSGDTLAFNNNDTASFGNIVASYNASTGVLTLTSAGATATVTQWAHAMSAVTFSSTSAVAGNRSIAFATSDGIKTSTASADTVNVLSPLQLTTDGGSAAFVAGDNTTSTPVAVDAGLTVTDTLAATLGSATVAITGNFHAGEDVLAFVNDGATMGNIVASYDAATGVLTLSSASASATLAQWQSALRAVTYTDTAITPYNGTRTVSFSATDGDGALSNTATRTVTVTDTDQSPVLTATGGTVHYVGGNGSVVVDAGVNVSDRDNATLASAAVAVTSGFQSGDVLAFVNTSAASFGNIQASYSNGVLLLTSIGSSATVAQWANALRAVTFSAGPDALPGSRTVAFQVNDGVKNSALGTDTVTVTAPPKIATDAGSAAFVAGDNATSTPVAIDSGLTVTDGSGTTLASATVAIVGNFHAGEDVLGFVNDGATMGNITGSYNSGTGVLTLTSSGASATLAQWQSALRSITYTDTQITPSNATRTIAFSAVDDAGYASPTATRTVTVTDTDQTPIVTTTGGTMNYVAGSSAAVIDGGIAVGDLDNTTQSSGTVAITGGFHVGDVLTFTNDNATTFGNIVGSYNASTGVLTLTSSGATATDAQWSHALSAVAFAAAGSAVPGLRTVSFATSDGTKTSAAATDTVNVLGLPTIVTDAGSAAFVAGDNQASTPVVIDAGLGLTDGASPTLASATVAITGNFHSGEDVLAFLNTDTARFGDIAGTYNAATGVLSLTSSGGSATLAQWQAALAAVTYTDTAVTPNNATRTISFSAVDAAAHASNTATRTVTVTDTDQTPIVTSTGGVANYVAGSSAAVIDGGITVSDLDNTTQSAGTVSITGGFHSSDTLTFINTSSATFGNIVGSYNAATGVLTLTSSGATASDAQWSHALSAVTFSASASAAPGQRTVSFATSDGTKTSAAATRAVDVLGPPTLTTDAGSAAFVAGDNTASMPVAVDPGLVLTDGASATLASATIAITGNFHGTEDRLAFVNDGATMGNITASYDAATGVLTLNSAGATATLTQWRTALGSVTYTDTAITPNTATRTISFSAVDGAGLASNTATRTVTVAATDQSPIVATTGGSTAFVAGDNAPSAPVAVDAGLSVSDRDNATLASATVAISGNFRAGQDLLAFVNDGATMGNIVASYDAATGVMTLTSSGASATVAQWQAALRSVTYVDTALTPDAATRTISFQTSDGTKSSVAATRSVTVTATDQTPVVTASGGSASFVAADNAASMPVRVDPGLALSDRDNTTLASATVAITGNFRAGEDVLAFANDGATMGNIAASYDAATGVLTLSSAGRTATVAQWQAALASVTYTDTAVTPATATRTIGFSVNDGSKSSAMATRSVTVADTDQTPVATTTTGSAAFVAGDNRTSTPVAIDPGIVLSDRDNTTLASATVAIGGGFRAGQDVLGFANDGMSMGNIAASYDAATGIMTLTSAGGTATVAQWQAALRSVTYTDTAITPDTAVRTVSFRVDDGAKTSAAATRTVTVAATDQTPVVATSGGHGIFGGVGVTAPIAVDAGITVADRDNTTLASATVSIVAGFRAGEDQLHFANDGATMGNIAGAYDAATGVLTLRSAGSTATLAQWQSALAAVTYADTGLAAPAGNRVVAFVVNDGTRDSVAATRTIAVNAGFAGQAGQFAAAPMPMGDTVQAPPHGELSAGSPAVLNAFAEPALLGTAAAEPYTITFTAPEARHAHAYDAQGGTRVDAAVRVLPDPIAVPFNIPVSTEHVGTAAPFTVGLASLAGPDERIVSVVQANGRSLPAWVSYDAATGTLRGHAPHEKTHELHLRVTMVDQRGHLTYRDVVIEVGKPAHGRTVPHPPTPASPQAAAKPSLNEQFARERQALHVAGAVRAQPSAPATHI